MTAEETDLSTEPSVLVRWPLRSCWSTIRRALSSAASPNPGPSSSCSMVPEMASASSERLVSQPSTSLSSHRRTIRLTTQASNRMSRTLRGRAARLGQAGGPAATGQVIDQAAYGPRDRLRRRPQRTERSGRKAYRATIPIERTFFEAVSVPARRAG